MLPSAGGFRCGSSPVLPRAFFSLLACFGFFGTRKQPSRRQAATLPAPATTLPPTHRPMGARRLSPDRDGRQRIWLKQLPTASEAPLTEGPDDFARFSPDGSMILFLRNDRVVSSLYSSGLVAPEPRKLLEDVSYADWSPDGSKSSLRAKGTSEDRCHRFVGIVGVDGGNSSGTARFTGDGDAPQVVSRRPDYRCES
jgi:hypothetical protein